MHRKGPKEGGAALSPSRPAHNPTPPLSWQEQLPALRSALSPSPALGVAQSLLALRACVDPKGPHSSSLRSGGAILSISRAPPSETVSEESLRASQDAHRATDQARGLTHKPGELTIRDVFLNAPNKSRKNLCKWARRCTSRRSVRRKAGWLYFLKTVTPAGRATRALPEDRSSIRGCLVLMSQTLWG